MFLENHKLLHMKSMIYFLNYVKYELNNVDIKSQLFPFGSYPEELRTCPHEICT